MQNPPSLPSIIPLPREKGSSALPFRWRGEELAKGCLLWTQEAQPAFNKLEIVLRNLISLKGVVFVVPSISQTKFGKPFFPPEMLSLSAFSSQTSQKPVI